MGDESLLLHGVQTLTVKLYLLLISDKKSSEQLDFVEETIGRGGCHYALSKEESETL